jgi:hypothetical protein
VTQPALWLNHDGFRGKQAAVRSRATSGGWQSDEVAMQGYDADKQQRVGIGGYYWYPGAVLRFRDLQIRSLKDGPC